MTNKVFKALSDPSRRKVLQMLKSGPLTAGEIADRFSVSKSTMSAHFSILREADLIDSEKVGKQVFYQLKLSVLEDALTTFAELFSIGIHANDSQKSTVNGLERSAHS